MTGGDQAGTKLRTAPHNSGSGTKLRTARLLTVGVGARLEVWRRDDHADASGGCGTGSDGSHGGVVAAEEWAGVAGSVRRARMGDVHVDAGCAGRDPRRTAARDRRAAGVRSLAHRK